VLPRCHDGNDAFHLVNGVVGRRFRTFVAIDWVVAPGRSRSKGSMTALQALDLPLDGTQKNSRKRNGAL